MNRIKDALNTVLALAIMATFVALAHPPRADAGIVDLPYQWILHLETKALVKQFEYQGSALRPVDKVEITYSPAKDDADKKLYEYLWYHDGKPLGLERKKQFGTPQGCLPQGDGIAIRVQHQKDASTRGEEKAAANAILRIALDAYLNKDAVALVKLPAASFHSISGFLQDQGMLIAPDLGGGGGDGFGVPLKSSLTLPLVSEPEGMKEVLYRP